MKVWNEKDLSKIKLVEVEDLSNRLVKTNVSMFSYRVVLEKMLPQLISQSNLTVYNCKQHKDGSPAGILEVGAEPKSLNLVIDNYCKNDIPDIANIKGLIRKDRDEVK